MFTPLIAREVRARDSPGLRLPEPFLTLCPSLPCPAPQQPPWAPLAPAHPQTPLVLLQVHRVPQGALARMELWVFLERGDLQAHQGLLVPLVPQPLLDHPTPGSPTMVSPPGSQQVQAKVG